MKIRILLIGKTKNKNYRTLVEDYRSRVERHIPITLEHLREGKGGQADHVKAEEGDSLLSRLDNADFVVALDERGSQTTSAEFSGIFEEWMVRGQRRVTFVIGGSHGLSEEVRGRADLLLALSSMTMAHDLALLVLTEQLYRALSIIRGEPYHK